MTSSDERIISTAPSYGRSPRLLLRDGSISDRAKALYALLDDYSDTEGRSFPARATLAGSLGCSVDSIDRALREIESLGWLTRTIRKRPDGSYTSTLYALQWQAQTATGGGRTGAATMPHGCRGGGRTGAEGVAARVQTEEEPHEEEPTKEEPMLTAGAASVPKIDRNCLAEAQKQFDHFWPTYPRKMGKQAARKAWPKAVRRLADATGMPPDQAARQIVTASRFMAADPNLPEKELIPYPATWLNRDGWDDEPYPRRERQPEPAGSTYTGPARAMSGAEFMAAAEHGSQQIREAMQHG